MKKMIDNSILLKHAISRAHQLEKKDAQVRDAQPKPEAMDEIERTTHSIEALALACRHYATRPALGFRDFELVRDLKSGLIISRFLPHFRTLKFSEIWARIVALSSGIQELKKDQDHSNKPIGIIGFSGVENVIADLTSLYLCRTSIPLPTHYSSEALLNIVNETELDLLFCSLEQIEMVLPILELCPTVRSLVIIDYCEVDDHQTALVLEAKKKITQKNHQISVSTLQEVEKQGRKRGPIPWITPLAGSDPLMTLCYTSGSTGTPKGALFPESLWARTWRKKWASPEIPAFPQITINYAPLNHMMGRIGVMNTLIQGGITYFTLKNDMSTLFEDIRLVRPTVLTLVPRISEMIYQYFQSKTIRSDTRTTEQTMMEMRNTFLGNRLLMILTGSAPTAPEVLGFLKECFDIPVLDGYGSTELGSITFENKINYKTITDYKLIDVPELGYHKTDKPFPRGELVVRSRQSVPGYFKNPEATKQFFDDEGFSRSGDIMEQHDADTLIWIDRKNNVIKLSQGEFVTLWNLESIFVGKSPFIQQIFLYGNSRREYLLAVIVPQMDALNSHFAIKNKEVTPHEIKHLLRSELSRIGKESQLRSFEIPRDFLVETTPFTRENGLLTGINKPARPQLKSKYEEKLEQLYINLEMKKTGNKSRLTLTRKPPTVRESLKRALQATLGLSDIEFVKSQSFTSLGGDSLSAVNLIAEIKDLCGVTLPINTILSPASSTEEIALQVEHLLKASQSLPNTETFEFIHGADAKQVREQDLQLDKFLDHQELSDATLLKLTALSSEIKNILLTGANGFLGRFLCLELLAQAKKNNGKIYCLIRGRSDHEALERLRAAYSSDPLLAEKFSDLAENRLTIFAGDLAQPKMGLQGEVYERISKEVDTIIHAGALVNHTLSYAQLFEPNVIGTVEVMRFALKNRPKRINYISTLGSVSDIKHKGLIREDDDIRKFSDTRSITSGYASGYSTSKWASEVLLRNFYDFYLIPINVFRPDMIMAHQIYRGQINAPDLFTRLLCSIVYTGIAPRSFYQTQPGSHITAHFDGLPVDFIASAITSICSQPTQEFSTYHVSNLYWGDGISLDRFMDWVQSSGVSLKRIPNYQKWFSRFGEVLRSLDEEQRQHSSLPILSQWEKPIPIGEGRNIDASHFQQKVHELKPQGRTEIPVLNEALIHKYLKDMQYLGLTHPPDLSQTTERKVS